MLREGSSPSYEELFGQLDFGGDDDARSVYSPAAYFVDLLGLLEGTFDGPALLGRRSDLRAITLDFDNTFVEQPYLDIVNEVLERLVGVTPYDNLRKRHHPFGLPFSLPAETTAKYLQHLQVTPLELYRLFAVRPDHDIVAREYLGMSTDDVDVVTTSVADVAGLAERYGVTALTELRVAERFAEATGLTGAQVRELLLVSPPVTLSTDGTTLVWGDTPPLAWLDRTHRFLRLARMTGLGSTDLALALTTYHPGDIDAAALRTLAIVLRLHRDHDLTVTDICRLVVPIEDEEVQGCSGDLLAPRNDDYRFRLAGWIDVAEDDIRTIVRRYRERYAGKDASPFDQGDLGLAAIGLLHRAGHLASTLGIAVDELFDVLLALDSDPTLRRHTSFPVLGEAGQRDCHAILAGDVPAETLWLAQTLFAVVTWAQAAGFSGQELTEVLGGRPDAADALNAVVDGIRAAFDQVSFDPGVFAGGRFSTRAATVVHDVLTAHDDGVVSPADDRLLRVTPEAAATAAYAAVTDLGMLVAEDFRDLGLGERLAEKIFANLVLLGHLSPDGMLMLDDAGQVTLASDFEPYRAELFKVLGTFAESTGAFFPSDVVDLNGMSPARQAELYDNLRHHGHVDENGDLTDPDFFLDTANEPYFLINVDLTDAAEAVADLLTERITAFAEEPLALDPAIFAELRLTDAELAALTESLTFNGYLDEQGRYRDKIALSTLDVANLGITPAFYPRRRAILAAVQEQIASFETQLHTFTSADFADVADEVMSRRALAALEETYTEHGRVTDESLFADPAGELDLGAGFTPAERTTIFGRVVTVLEDEKPYRLAPTDLSDLGFDDDECGQVLALLVETGYLTENLAVTREWLPYFRNLDNAYSFALPDLPDFSTDIFFLLHAVAGELTAAVNDVVDLLATRERDQKDALHQSFADALGLPAATAAAIVAAVTGGPAEALDVLVTPVLATEKPLTEPHFRLACRRIRRFALLAAKLGLDATEVTAVFRDQDLVGKFPENLVLPPGVRRFDALLEGHDGKILVFAGTGFWTYAADTYALKSSVAAPLTDLSPRFIDLAGIDAAFTVPSGQEWLVGHTTAGVSRAFVRRRGGTRWAPQDQLWGTVKNNFTAPDRIDGAFADRDGRTYLFAGDQYIRYSTTDYTAVDEGYPRPIAEWREREGFATGPGPLDAFQAPDGTTHVLTGATGWGRVRNAFENAGRLDAAHSGGAAVHLFAGGQVVRYSDSIENDGVRVDEGYPRNIQGAINGVPARFESGVEATFVDPNGVLHLFKDGRTASVGGTDTEIVPTAQRWGVLPPALPSGTVDAAFAGLDGKTYLFSGGTYVRYSTADYSAVDDGYPRAIDADWAGLSSVDAAFTLDGSTYLFGAGGLLFDLTDDLRADLTAGRLTPALRNRFTEHGFTPTAITHIGTQWTVTTAAGHTLSVRVEGLRTKVFGDGARCYVRYSTKDYRTPDAGFPKPLSDNWWNMPAGLEFGAVDAVFTGRDDQTYLFSGGQFLRFDARRRWWSRPMSLRERWDSVPFDHIDAAFLGQDGRTYLFSGDRYVRYSTDDHTEVDDGYPAVVPGFWGNVENNIERTGRVDATLVTEVTEKVDGVDVPHTFTYLFSGDQYVRYLGADHARVQLGYPRRLTSLRTEPGLAALDVELTGVDAAFADRRTTYLFSGGLCHAVSASTNKRYDDLSLAGVSCAFMENGSIVTDSYPEGWVRRSALEGRGGSVATPFRPRTLRTVPQEFRHGLDSVLTGVDGNTYLFKGATCFNTQLGRGYPLAEEWGRPRNTIYEQGRVDAAFVGRDGKTYLFSDDQFVVYPGTGTTIEGDPKPVAEHWAGFGGVALAYVQGEQTHLFEHPDEDGMLRHLVYSGTDYTTPDEGYPELVDDGVFAAPDGFPFPDAVLAEGDTLTLLSHEDCLSHNTKTGAWSVVRPIRRLFPGFGEGLDAPDGLRAAFTARDGATYFFFDDTHARFADGVAGPLTPTRDRWGLSPNPFVTTGGSVDAAFVWRQHTYLFSGDRYVRYTGPGYRAIDPGYPRKTAGNLRLEEPFANLPETFDDALDAPITAVVGNDRTIHVLIGGVCHTVSPRLTGTYSLDGVGRPRNTIADTGKVDAALVADRRVYLLSGDQYVRYSTADHTHVDDGYPKPLGELAAELGVPALPPAFTEGVDAAFRSPDGRTYLFRGKEFVRGDAPEPVTGVFGKVRNEFTSGGPAAAFVAPTGALYAFSGDQYIRYSGGVPVEFVDQGFPRTVRDDWGDLPPEFEDGPDGAFVFEGRTHLTKGERYVRYSGSHDRVDRTFPQEFAHRFASTSDYRLSDLHTIVRFVDLARSRPDGLAALFVTGAADPYQVLSELFGWHVEELRWARRNSDLLVTSTHEEQVVEIEFVLALVDLFATARKFGVGPSRIHAEVWSKLHGTPDLPAAAAALYSMLERRTGPAAWPALATQIHNELNVLKRDALVAALAPRHGGSRELFEQYLIDVDMGPVGTTSRVREAIAATQLFLHRYLIDLETVALPDDDTDPDDVKARIRTWWAWMKNYRIWEANRKVFLYPENYLRPELRARKTPAFAALEDDLLQHEITAESVQSAYKRYLDEYTEVSRLAIAGGYVYTEDGAEKGVRKLVLFGRTRTEPHRYYYRGATFRDGDRFSTTWEPWETVDVQIAAERVSPVHAFGRVFVFWPVAEVVTPDSSTTRITTTPTTGGQEVKASPPVYQVKIYYSFYDLNHKWVPAQLLTVETTPAGPVTDLSLYVQASRDVPGVGTHDSIVVQSSYRAGGTDQVRAYTLTPELYPLPITEFTRPAEHGDPALIFDEPATTPIENAKVVPFNAPADNADDPWFSVDHKGGSFLCRPVGGPVQAEPLIRLHGNGVNLPTTWEQIDAAFELPNSERTRYFFDSRNGKYVSAAHDKPASGKKLLTTADDIGLVRTTMHETEDVDAVLVREHHVYLFSGDEYYRYARGNFGRLDEGFPKKLRDNSDSLPEWSSVDAVFADQHGTEYFYSRERKGYAAAGAFGTIVLTADQWPELGANQLDSILMRGGRAHLVFKDKYIRLGGDLKARTGPLDLDKNQHGLPHEPIAGPSFEHGGGVVTFDNKQGTYKVRPGGNDTRYIRDLGRVPTAISRTGHIHAAYLSEVGTDTFLFLVSGIEFVRYTLNDDGTLPGYIDPGYPKEATKYVDAVFSRGGRRYVFSGHNYSVLADGKELDAELALRPIAGNWRCLPDGFVHRRTGVLETATTLFVFSRDRDAYYAAYPANESAPRPYEVSTLPNQVIRLTSSIASELNRRLLVGGIDALLAPETQELNELPAFSTTESGATTIRVPATTDSAGVPVGSHLDFDSSNGLYYWEIFFHAPMLIARALGDAQRFADAKRWYEYVFDPTRRRRYWRFLPFLAVDVDALVAGCRADLLVLGNDTVTAGLTGTLDTIEPMAPAFLPARELTKKESDSLVVLAGTKLDQVKANLTGLADLTRPQAEARRSLLERVEMIKLLDRQHKLLTGDRDSLMAAYRDDPFDPHAIAALRPAAYRRTVVMAYIDNLLDWGDLLFRQYTGESIDEARMLYIFAHDLLGPRPYDTGPRALPRAATYDELDGAGGAETVAHLTANGALLEGSGAVHLGVVNPYFYVPDNTVFLEYWTRVADRLTKIRASLDIMGISRPVPLFEPPVDVMALVEGVAKGASLDQITAALAAPVPAYRFNFLLRRAQELTDRLRQLGTDLLGAFERRDAEELSLLQNRQEAAILELTRNIKEHQIEIAEQGLREMQAGLRGAQGRVTHYQGLITAGLSPLQHAQLAMMSTGAALHFVSGGLKIGAAVASAIPETYYGPFIMGASWGGAELGDSLEVASDVSSTLAEGFSMLGEVLGVRADQERQEEDWRLQLATSRIDVEQLGHQVRGAELQVAVARRELAVLEREIRNVDEVATFLHSKFAGQQLYNWMVQRLSELYFQAYHLAYEMARAAEKAFQFERGDGSFIQPTYWASKQGGLLAADALSLDLDRLGQAYVTGDRRGLEITRKISLARLDPMALLALKNEGRCEFAFTEELFDRDFPGHYQRQIRTVSVSFEAHDGPVGVNATLTQLDNKTVLSADPKAVKFLLDPKGSPPASLRGDWRPSQQIALSDLEDGRDNNGLFELRYDDDRYLPFEGTGAVSRWRLAGRVPDELADVTVTVKYTAEQGGETFATAVKGMLRPYPSARYLDIANEFPSEWEAFLTGESDELNFYLEPSHLPGIAGRQITGVLATYDLAIEGEARFLLNGNERLALDGGKLVRTPGMTTGGWILVFEGDKTVVANLGLIVTYRASAQ